ncbi:MAG: LysM peptidoglycan-binding domain-containing protein [Pseudomonadota bacterium]
MQRGLIAAFLGSAVAFVALAVWLVLSGRPGDAPARVEAPDPQPVAPLAESVEPSRDQISPVEPAAPVPELAEVTPPAGPDPDQTVLELTEDVPDVVARPPTPVEDTTPAGRETLVIDVVRVDPEGRTVIAGRAAPSTRVEILLDGAVIGREDTDSTGSFVSILTLPPSAEPRELRLRSPLPPEQAWRAPMGPPIRAVVADAVPVAASAPDIANAAEAPVAPAVSDGGSDRPAQASHSAAPRWISVAPAGPVDPIGSIFRPANVSGAVARSDPVSAQRTASRPDAPVPIPWLTVPELRHLPEAATLDEVAPSHTAQPGAPIFGLDESDLAISGQASDPQARTAAPRALWRPFGPNRALRRPPMVGEDAVSADDLPLPEGLRRVRPELAGRAVGPVWRLPPGGRASDWPDRSGRRLQPDARLRQSAPPAGPRFVPAIPRYGDAPQRPHVLPGRPGTLATALSAEMITLLAAEPPRPARTVHIVAMASDDSAVGAVPAGPAAPPTPRLGLPAARAELAPSLGHMRLRAAGTVPEPRRLVRASPRTISAGWIAPTQRRRLVVPAKPDLAPLLYQEQISAAARSAEPRFVLSAPVLILPVAGTDQAPLLVQPKAASVAVLQTPEPRAPGLVVESMTHPDGGAVTVRGHARPDHAVRLYVNALYETETAVARDGSWMLSMPREAGEAARLLRFDEIDRNGAVTARVEVPFTYSRGDAALRLSQREVEIQRGDHLWRLAEQHYGEGLRYSLIFEANAELIRDPDLIYPGQVFRVPEFVPDTEPLQARTR